MRKRIISTLMALCMALTLLPVQVLAANYATGEDAGVSARALAGTAGTELKADNIATYVANGLGNGVYTLAEDVTISGTLKVTGEAAVDLNGYVLRYADTTAKGSVFEIVSGGSLTVIDSRPNVEHKFTPNADGLWIWNETSGTEIVRGGIITGGTGLTDRNNNGYGGGVYVDGGGRFTMTGGSIVGCKAEGYIAFGGGVFVAKGGQFTMTGGSIVGCTAVADEYGHAYGGGIRNDGDDNNSNVGRTTLSGTAEIRDCHAKGAFQLYGGGISDAGTLTISGDVKIIGCTAGGMGSDAMYVNARNDSSVTGGTFYGSIQDPGNKISGLIVTYRINDADYAIQVLQSGDQITLPDPAKLGYTFDGWYKDGAKWEKTTLVTENITLTGSLYVPVTNETELKAALADDTVDIIQLTDDIDIGSSLTILRKLTLDLNGHVLKMTGSGSVIILDDNNGMTTGNLTLIDSDPTAEHKFKVNGVEPWVPDDSGTETVYGGIITGGNADKGGGVYMKKGGEFTMTAGNIVGCTAKYGGGLYFQESSFTMTGGSIVGCSSTMRAAGEPLYSGIHCLGTSNNVYKENPNVITLTGGLIKNNGRLAINALYNTIIYANGGEIYGNVGVYQACKITGLAGKTGVTAFRGWTLIKGASNIPENISHVDWGLFYGGLGISGDTTTGIIVTYKDGDNEYAKQVLPSAGPATCPDALGDKTGYTFGGWKRADGTAWDFTKDTVTENITLSAKWIPHTYTVTFDSTGGSEVTTKTIDVTYGEPLGGMSVPKREGYVFLGWYDALVGGKCYGDSDGESTSPYDKDVSITLYAQWAEAPSRMVCFNTCGGTMTGPTEVLHKLNTPIAKPDNPTKTGHSFNGWYTDSALTQAWSFDDWVTGELSLYAGWTVDQHTITFDTNGGSEIASITQDYGTQITAPAAPQKTGYAFGGWYLGEEAYDFAAVVTEDMTLTAKWTVCGHKGSTAQPTCTDAVKCTVCGSTLPALGHEWGPWTSGSDNTHTRACKRDGAHTETKSCVDADRDHMCDACGQTISGHTGGTATCTAKAVCSVCGQSYGAVDTANHDLKHTAAKEPGAFVPGRIEYWTCRTCGKYFADAGGAKEISRDDIIIPRLGAAADSEGGKASPATFDAGIGVSAVAAVTSLTGLALLRRKRRSGE